MGEIKFRVKFGTDNELEVISNNSSELALLIDQATEKFFPDTKYLKKKLAD